MTKAEWIVNHVARHTAPAFSDGDYIYTPDMKYAVYPTSVAGRDGWFVSEENNLVQAGFDRGMSNCCHGVYETWAAFAVYNTAADLWRIELWDKAITARKNAERLAMEARERAEMEARRRAEHRASCDALLAAAKFKKQSVKLGIDTAEPISVDAWAWQGVAVHRAYCINESYAKRAPYTLTHIQSGLAMMTDLSTLAEAKLAAVRLARITDMTQDAKFIASYGPVRDLAGAIRRSKDAYAIAVNPNTGLEWTA